MNELLTLEAPVSGYEMPERQENFGTEVDLASRWLGGSVLAASDESFGEKEALLTPTPSAFVPGNYGPRGEIVDGWETRRRREAGHDWALIRLGAPGIITSIDVDTSCFTGNFPMECPAPTANCPDLHNAVIVLDGQTGEFISGTYQ